MNRLLTSCLALLAAAVLRAQPAATYVLRVDSADLSGFSVEIRLRNTAPGFALAMAAHPEYDDKYWRYVEGLRVEVSGNPAPVVREDSALWRVHGVAGDAVVRYRIRLPQPQQNPRAAWRPFLSPTGGLVGGPHSFMYVPGAERSASLVRLELPPSWSVATSLTAASEARTWTAPDAATLLESPIQVGVQRSWRFAVNGVTHHVYYWPLPAAMAFDTAAFVGDIERLAREAIRLFGGAPWTEYTFLLQDGAFGGLEHANSVTIGAPSADLARDPHAYSSEIAHEFFHAWNLMRIRPLGYGLLSYRAPAMSKGLWFSEGLSMFYADLLARRAGLPTQDSSRATHLAGLIGRYLANPGNGRLSAERVSEAAYAPEPGTLGDLDASTHLQGELIGAMLDFVIRDGSRGTRSADDLMRTMLERHAGDRGFTSVDVERVVSGLCSCTVTPFFDAHVRRGSPIDFDRHLRLAGLRAQVTWGPALERDGRPSPDRRVRAWVSGRDRAVLLLVWHPASAWARAGLRTGDRIVSLDGTPPADFNAFRSWLGALRVGDTARVVVTRGSGTVRASVAIAPFDRPFVRVEPSPEATASQRAIGARWLAGQP